MMTESELLERMTLGELRRQLALDVIEAEEQRRQARHQKLRQASGASGSSGRFRRGARR